MRTTRSLSEIGHIIKTLASSLDEANLPQPSLVHVYPSVSPYALQDTRAELLDALEELRSLVLGPVSYIYFTSILSVCSTTPPNLIKPAVLTIYYHTASVDCDF
jgi:hypothetical protein